MRKELDDILVEDFPNLYRDRHAPMTHTCMCWGFPGDGWFDLIYKLSEKLEPFCEGTELRAVQVKEKFGELRFYMSSYDPETELLVDVAEEESRRTCERCGKGGELRRDLSWVLTLCDKCHQARLKRHELL